MQVNVSTCLHSSLPLTLSQTDRAAVRKVALHGIRATDMALHFDKCKELEKLDGMR